MNLLPRVFFHSHVWFCYLVTNFIPFVYIARQNVAGDTRTVRLTWDKQSRFCHLRFPFLSETVSPRISSLHNRTANVCALTESVDKCKYMCLCKHILVGASRSNDLRDGLLNNSAMWRNTLIKRPLWFDLQYFGTCFVSLRILLSIDHEKFTRRLSIL